jgi:opacity protein-like surface antigen
MKIHKSDHPQKRPGLCQHLVILPILLVIPFLLMLAESGQAQTVYKAAHGEWEASIFAGGSFLGSGEYDTPIEGTGQSRTVGLKYDSGFQIGGRITANRWEHWGAEGEYSFSDQAVTFSNISDDYASLTLDHSIHRIAYNVIYYIYDRNSRLRPYLLGGPGVTLFHISGSTKDAAKAQGIPISDPWKFTMNWGGGFRYLLKKQIAVSAQFSDSISGVPAYGLPDVGRYVDTTYIPGFSPSGVMHNWLISGGFVYQWDDR